MQHEGDVDHLAGVFGGILHSDGVADDANVVHLQLEVHAGDVASHGQQQSQCLSHARTFCVRCDLGW